MKISAMLITSDYRGDHATDVKIAINVTEDTTLKELIHSHFERMDSGVDHIELRIIKELEDG